MHYKDAVLDAMTMSTSIIKKICVLVAFKSVYTA